MIFEQMSSIEAVHARKVANFSNWGGQRYAQGMRAPENTAPQHAARRQTLLDHACLPIEDAAKKYGFDSDEYRSLAVRDQALLFVTETGEEFVPGWSFGANKQIIPAALAVAKAYVKKEKHDRAGDEVSPAAFCTFISEHQVYMDASMLKDETGKHQALTAAFAPAPYEADQREPEINVAARSLKKTIYLTADGVNDAYASEMLNHTIKVLFKEGHEPDTAEDIVRILRTQAAKRSGIKLVP